MFPRLRYLFREINEFGPLHIIVADGNIDDHHLDACTPKTAEEAELISLLRKLDVEQRDQAWEQAVRPD